MCIALPRKVIAVVDAERAVVALATEDGTSTGEAETVSAALLVDAERRVETLVGAWMLIHAGFALAIIDDEDARSRLQMFAAMRGDTGVLDISDLHAGLHAELDPDPPAAPTRRGDMI